MDEWMDGWRMKGNTINKCDECCSASIEQSINQSKGQEQRLRGAAMAIILLQRWQQGEK